RSKRDWSSDVCSSDLIAMDPMLAMYDEPFGGLDPISINVIANLIRQLNDSLGATSVVVSYDVSEAVKLVDYVYVIADGVVAGEEIGRASCRERGEGAG